MPYDFSADALGTNLHIRVTPNFVQKGVLIDERPHKHSFLEFHYIFDGEETVLLPKEGKKIALAPGDLALIPRAVYHCAETGPGKGVSRLCFNFSAEAESDSPILRAFRNEEQVQVFRDLHIQSEMQRFREIMEDREDPFGEMREGVVLLDVILDIFHRFSSEKAAPRAKNQNKLRQKWLIEEHIGTRYHAPDGLKGLAEKLYLSQRQTRKLVRQFCGEDYKTLIVRQRMEMAQILLQSHDLSLEEVAETVGYRSYSGFHLAFVRSFGVTPGEYQKKQMT